MAYLSQMIANEIKNGPRCLPSVFGFDTSTLSQMIVNDISDIDITNGQIALEGGQKWFMADLDVWK